MHKQIQQQVDKKRKEDKKNRELGIDKGEPKSSNAYKSGNFFRNLSSI
jgi:hypothetical protein